MNSVQQGNPTVRARLLENVAIAKPWQTNGALLLLGFCMLRLSTQLVSEYDHFTIGFSGVSGWSLLVYLLTILIILTQPVDRYTFPIILTVGIACRLAVLFADPYLSSDVYRYVWDGIVQHAHISPYRYVPGDKALSFLWPPNQDIFDNINRRNYARTIYPPAAQALFYVATFISPTVTFMKTTMVLFEGITVWASVQLMHYLGVRRERVVLYAWCPLLIWEIAGSGHLDSVAMAFIALACLFRYRGRPVMTGVFLGLAVITKLYPLVLLPALYRRGEWKMPAALGTVIATGYLAYSSVGLLVFGFLGGYVQEEGMATGSRYFLLELVQKIRGLENLPASLYLGFAALVFLSLTVVAWKTCCRYNSSPDSFLWVATFFAAALMLLFSPHYAWYIAWLVPFFALKPNLPLLAYLMGFFYLYTTNLATPGPRMFLANKILYGLVASACCLELLLRHWPLHRTLLIPYAVTKEAS